MIYERNLSGEHEEVFGLFPWYLNGTLAETDRRRVDEHVAVCAACRDQLAREREIYRAMSSESSVEFIPASFSRLQARLDALSAEEGASSEPSVRQSAGGSRTPGRRARMLWPRYAAASIAVLALGALGLVSAGRWMHGGALPSEYRTVTTSAPRPPDEVIRAVFAPAITLVELQAILDEAQLRIVSGPTEAGVYSLAANSDRPVTDSLSLLRRHASVRFAESTRIDPRAAGGPR
jgi:predicted anti-sigma-YlaC factor YlaD